MRYDNVLAPQAHCERLSVMSEFEDLMELLEAEEPEAFTRCLTDSGLRWLALASANQKAHEAMHAVPGAAPSPPPSPSPPQQGIFYQLALRKSAAAFYSLRSSFRSFYADRSESNLDSMKQLLAEFAQQIAEFCGVAEFVLQQSRARLPQLERRCNDFTERIESVTKEIDKLSTYLAGCKSRVSDCQRQVSSLEAERSSLRRQKELKMEDNREAVKDAVIPFYGLVKAFQTGDATRAIPLKRAVDAALSAIDRDIERLEQRLNDKSSEIRGAEAELSGCKSSLGALQDEWHGSRRTVERLRRELAAAHDGISQTAAMKTTMENMHRDLLLLSSRSAVRGIVHTAVKDAQELLRDDMLEEADVRQLRTMLREMDSTFNAIAATTNSATTTTTTTTTSAKREFLKDILATAGNPLGGGGTSVSASASAKGRSERSDR